MIDKYIPYHIASELKKIGYNESSYYLYMNYFDVKRSNINRDWNNESVYITAPTYQEVFDWIFDKYKLYASIYPTVDSFWYIKIIDLKNYPEVTSINIKIESSQYLTYSEARVSALRLLISTINESI
jgi:hypothetical protein